MISFPRGAAIPISAVTGYVQVSQPQYVDLTYTTSAHTGSTNPTPSGYRFYRYTIISQPKIQMLSKMWPLLECRQLSCVGVIGCCGQNWNLAL